MNKKELIKKASAASGIPQQTIHTCFEIVLDSMAEALNEGHAITISNFGTFRVKELEERLVRNPKNGLTSVADKKLRISFKTSPGLYRKEE